MIHLKIKGTIGRYLILIGLLSSVLSACQGPSAEAEAKRLCNCYAPDSEAAQQLRAGEIDRTTYMNSIGDCMGDYNPLETFGDDEEARLKFKGKFIEALEKNCPDISRTLGY